MERESRKVLVSRTDPNAGQARKTFDAGKLEGLKASMLAIGQQVPVIVVEVADRYLLVDGECRYRAAKLAGIPELDAVVLKKMPTPVQLLVTQTALDVHRTSLTPMERSNLLARLAKETGAGVGELCGMVSISQPMASKLMALQRLDAALQKKLDAGELDIEKAYLISQADAAKQLDLFAAAPTLTRDQLRQRVKAPADKVEVKASKASFPLPGGVCVAVQGNELTLSRVIDCMAGLGKELKRALGQGLDITTAARVLADKAKVKA